MEPEITKEIESTASFFQRIKHDTITSIEEVPAGTLMRVERDVKIVTSVNPKTKEETTTSTVIGEKKEVLWGKTKQNIVAELDSRKALVEAEKTAEVEKLEALKVELSK